MANSNGSAGLWIAGIVGLIGIGTWLALSETPGAKEHPVQAEVPAAIPPAPKQTSVYVVGSGVPRISPHGRLTLDRASLPTDGPLALELDLTDEARGIGERPVKVLSLDGRRTDTTASPLPGAGSGVRLEIDPSFLTPGRYMIEIDTEDKHPLSIRRYVLELR